MTIFGVSVISRRKYSYFKLTPLINETDRLFRKAVFSG